MGIPPNDESYALVTQALSTHFDKAVAAGAARKDAMKSTFVVACLSPTTFGMGL
jgi:hypothetical protein